MVWRVMFTSIRSDVHSCLTTYNGGEGYDGDSTKNTLFLPLCLVSKSLYREIGIDYAHQYADDEQQDDDFDAVVEEKVYCFLYYI